MNASASPKEKLRGYILWRSELKETMKNLRAGCADKEIRTMLKFEIEVANSRSGNNHGKYLLE